MAGCTTNSTVPSTAMHATHMYIYKYIHKCSYIYKHTYIHRCVSIYNIYICSGIYICTSIYTRRGLDSSRGMAIRPIRWWRALRCTPYSLGRLFCSPPLQVCVYVYVRACVKCSRYKRARHQLHHTIALNTNRTQIKSPQRNISGSSLLLTRASVSR